MSAASIAAVATAITTVAARGGAATILCHVRPDADTIGSGLALGTALHRLGIDVEVAYPGPEPLPAVLGLLPGSDLLVAADQVRGHELVIAVDTASPERLDGLENHLRAAAVSIVIDHHRSNVGFADLDVIDPEADCTATLVLRVLDDLGVEIDTCIATCLYAGLATDTGSFRWARPESFRMAARLIELGIDARSWSRLLLDTHPFAWFAMVGKVVGSAQLDLAACGGHGLVYAVVDRESLTGMSWEESESVVDIVRTAAEAEVAAVFKEVGPDSWTVSLRSKSSVDLVPIARAHGGGGHYHAAGYSDAGSARDVIARLRDSL